MKSLLRGVADFLLPPECEHCGRYARPPEPLCWKCLRSLRPVAPADIDAVLALSPLPAPNVDLRCGWYFDRDGPLRDVLHGMKYSNRPWYGTFLGRVLSAQLTDISGRTLVVPVPLHRVRYLERGYNQSAWIAAEISRRLDLPISTRMLRRNRPTPTQTNLERDARWDNVRDAFSVQTEVEEGAPPSRVLLVDDVITTGATAMTAALALIASGAEHVTVATAGLANN